MLSIASSSLRVAPTPTIGPVIVTGGPGAAAQFQLSRHIDAVGAVTFAGNAGESATGWQVGFLQVEWVETNWAIYRGGQVADGSALIQRGRAPARPKQACMDNGAPGAPFYGAATDPAYAPAGEAASIGDVASLPANPAFPFSVKIYHYDKPADEFPLQRTNGRTGKPNQLVAAQLEFLFCAMLVSRSPGGHYKYLNGFYWNTRWQSSFGIVHGTTIALPVAGGTGTSVGKVFNGRPADRRFRSVLDHPPHSNCNDVAAYAGSNPNVRESDRCDHAFDVRH